MKEANTEESTKMGHLSNNVMVKPHEERGKSLYTAMKEVNTEESTKMGHFSNNVLKTHEERVNKGKSTLSATIERDEEEVKDDDILLEDDDDSEFSALFKAKDNPKHFMFYRQKIEMDIYIITSYFFMIFFPCLLLFISYIFHCLYDACLGSCFKRSNKTPDEDNNELSCQDNLTFAFRSFVLTIILAIILSILIFPGLFVIVTQGFCVIFLSQMEIDQNPNVMEGNLVILQALLIIVLSFMVSQETSQAVNTTYYLFTLMINSLKTNIITDLKGVWRKRRVYAFVGISLLIILIFPLIQVTVVIFLLNMAISTILSTTDTLNLIQNFAGLYIVLEFDNLVLKFFGIFPWKSLVYEILKKKFFLNYSIEKILRTECLNTKKLFIVLDVNEEEGIDFSFKDTFGKKWSYFFVGLKIIIIITAMILSYSDYIFL